MTPIRLSMLEVSRGLRLHGVVVPTAPTAAAFLGHLAVALRTRRATRLSLAKRVRLAGGNSPWSQQKSRGRYGFKWVNSQTGEVRYQREQPGTHSHSGSGDDVDVHSGRAETILNSVSGPYAKKNISEFTQELEKRVKNGQIDAPKLQGIWETVIGGKAPNDPQQIIDGIEAGLHNLADQKSNKDKGLFTDPGSAIQSAEHAAANPKNAAQRATERGEFPPDSAFKPPPEKTSQPPAPAKQQESAPAKSEPPSAMDNLKAKFDEAEHPVINALASEDEPLWPDLKTNFKSDHHAKEFLDDMASMFGMHPDGFRTFQEQIGAIRNKIAIMNGTKKQNQQVDPYSAKSTVEQNMENAGRAAASARPLSSEERAAAMKAKALQPLPAPPGQPQRPNRPLSSEERAELARDRKPPSRPLSAEERAAAMRNRKT